MSFISLIGDKSQKFISLSDRNALISKFLGIYPFFIQCATHPFEARWNVENFFSWRSSISLIFLSSLFKRRFFFRANKCQDSVTQVRLKSGNWQKRCVWAPCSTHIANYCSMQFDDSYCFVRSHDNCLKMRWFFPHLRHFLMTGWNVTNITFRWWWFPAKNFGIWPILSNDEV